MLIGKKAPSFIAPAVIDGNKIINNFSLEQYIKKKNIVLFFYPKDFTFVCPTELLAFQHYLEDFKIRDTEVIACSTDTENSHLAWLQTPTEKGGISGVKYPIIADTSKLISDKFRVLGGNWIMNDDCEIEFEGIPIAFRGTFFIDKNSIIRHQSINDLPLGRNVEEIIRIVDMWQHHEENGNVCPANWNIGKKSIKANTESVSKYLNQFYTKDKQTNSCCNEACENENKKNCCSNKQIMEEPTYDNLN